MANEKLMPDSELEARYERYKGVIKNFTLMSDIFMRNVFTALGSDTMRDE